MSPIGRHVSKLSGYAPALPTPFDDDDSVDADAFAQLCELQIRHGATALVVGGTTGEAPTLSDAEYGKLVRIAVAIARHRVPVIAGSGANGAAVRRAHRRHDRNAERPAQCRPPRHGRLGRYRASRGVIVSTPVGREDR